MMVNGNNSLVSMKTRCNLAKGLHPERGANSVAASLALLTLSRYLQHILNADTPVATTRQATERKHAVFAETIHELASHAHELGGLSGCYFIVGTHNHNPRSISDSIKHRPHRRLNRRVTSQPLRETLGVGAHSRVNRIEGNGKRVCSHAPILAVTAIMTTGATVWLSPGLLPHRLTSDTESLANAIHTHALRAGCSHSVHFLVCRVRGRLLGSADISINGSSAPSSASPASCLSRFHAETSLSTLGRLFP